VGRWDKLRDKKGGPCETKDQCNGKHGGAIVRKARLQDENGCLPRTDSHGTAEETDFNDGVQIEEVSPSARSEADEPSPEGEGWEQLKEKKE